MKKSDVAIVLVVILIYVVLFSGIVQTASIEGVSMYPVFQNGFLTFYVSPSDISVGNIVIYKSTVGTYVIHQVIHIDGNSYVTKGVDNITNYLPDNKIGLEPQSGIPKTAVIGKVAEVNGFVISIPYLGYISILFSSL
ncbi:signal peptidase I [Sulfolobus acidocaldarius]|uniref:Conserved Archaeal protein n=4 Tax=Sulfolobus acidocaldarius TaxID=2285 RepID=Q4J917_SULAC|nr:signal peptidase I [Sulfolobus acidocaldarius]AAY80713.1 conserved Archaeal protein [Sulfolobus acidocaldarius DSM 639]AGE71310.1 peptidase S26B, signal peptidase [Sulfolobus acidocaldarius N8]AGE73579.1 peptidase S26B, signal peptidase [Sulfolobus acidocaldarius Ron12/I]ALU30434.1 S26 family signal peptidase [Sulfolobus acidocaldarius]ALU31155.1 S26 family signal peptidase [Sulfolobus acidocaldarius]